MSNEKKKLHASTILISLSIVILIAVAVFLGYSYYKEKQHAANLQEEVRIYTDKANTLESDVLTTKQELEAVKNQEGKKPGSEVFKNVYFDPNKGPKELKESIYRLENKILGADNNIVIELQSDGKAIFLNQYDDEFYVKEKVVSNSNEIVAKKSQPTEITGFTKKVVDVVLGYGPGTSFSGYAIFLMEDGTCQYINLKDMLTNPKAKNAIPSVNNIVRIERANVGSRNTSDGGGGSAIVGIDKNGDFYDLSDLIRKTGYKLN